MVLALAEVTLVPNKSAELPWSSVTFTAANPKVLPDLGDYAESLGAASTGKSDVKFAFDAGLLETVMLPAGDWKVAWKSTDSSAQPKDGGTITVRADAVNELAVPE